MVVSGAVERIFMLTSLHAKAMARKVNWASHGPRVLAKERAGKVRGGITSSGQNNPKVPRVPKLRTRVKLRKLVLCGVEKPQSETRSETQEPAQTYHTDNSYMDNSWFDDGWSCDDRNDDRNSLGWHECCEQTFDNSANSISLGGFHLGARSSPKRVEWVKMNLVSGAAVNTGPLNFGPDGAGDGRFFWTVVTMKTTCADLWNGRLTGVQKFCQHLQLSLWAHKWSQQNPILWTILSSQETSWQGRAHTWVQRKHSDLGSATGKCRDGERWWWRTCGSGGSQSKNESQELHESRESWTWRFWTWWIYAVCRKVAVLLVSKALELVDNIELHCWMKRREEEQLPLLLSLTV